MCSHLPSVFNYSFHYRSLAQLSLNVLLTRECVFWLTFTFNGQTIIRMSHTTCDWLTGRALSALITMDEKLALRCRRTWSPLPRTHICKLDFAMTAQVLHSAASQNQMTAVCTRTRWERYHLSPILLHSATSLALPHTSPLASFSPLCMRLCRVQVQPSLTLQQLSPLSPPVFTMHIHTVQGSAWFYRRGYHE